MQVQIKFTKTGANAAFGGFSPGDVARVSPQLASHFVDEAGVAVYTGEKAEKQPELAEKPAVAPAKKPKK